MPPTAEQGTINVQSGIMITDLAMLVLLFEKYSSGPSSKANLVSRAVREFVELALVAGEIERIPADQTGFEKAHSILQMYGIDFSRRKRSNEQLKRALVSAAGLLKYSHPVRMTDTPEKGVDRDYWNSIKEIEQKAFNATTMSAEEAQFQADLKAESDKVVQERKETERAKAAQKISDSQSGIEKAKKHLMIAESGSTDEWRNLMFDDMSTEQQEIVLKERVEEEKAQNKKFRNFKPTASV